MVVQATHSMHVAATTRWQWHSEGRPVPRVCHAAMLLLLLQLLVLVLVLLLVLLLLVLLLLLCMLDWVTRTC